MKNLFLFILLLLTALAGFKTAAQQKNLPPYASEKPMLAPQVFVPGVISTEDYESHPEFTPDGKTLYFLKNAPNFGHWTICVSRFKNGKWSQPEVASFSGQYSDADPFITDDGTKFFFISTRPMDTTTKQDLDIWVMEKTAGGWSEPRNLGAPVNSPANEWFPTVAVNGNLYFGSEREGGKGRVDIYRCKWENGKYSEPENLGDSINTRFAEFEPYIAPDESFMIFMAGRPEGLGGFDFFISYNHNQVWTQAKNLRAPLNSSGNELSPQISPDGKYFFFTSTRGFGDEPLKKRLNYKELLDRLHNPGNGLGDIYQVDLSTLGIQSR